MDSLRLCLSCAGRRHHHRDNGRGDIKSDRRSSNSRCFGKRSRRDVASSQCSASPVTPAPAVVDDDDDDSLEKVLEHAAQDDQPDTPGYWRNRGIGDVDTPPIRRRVLLLPPPPPSCSSSSNSIVSFDSCIYIYRFICFIYLFEKKIIKLNFLVFIF